MREQKAILVALGILPLALVAAGPVMAHGGSHGDGATAHSAALAGAGFDPGRYGGKAGMVSGFNTSLVEPNTPKYVHYCGPAASRVLISAWTRSVPSLDALAAEERTNPRSGTNPANMVGPINRAVGSNYYGLRHASTQGALSNVIGESILGAHHPLIVGLRTQPLGSRVPSLNGWNQSVLHFTMVYGFDFRRPNVGYIYYFEIASSLAGTTAAGKNQINYNSFWDLARMYDVQITGR